MKNTRKKAKYTRPRLIRAPLHPELRAELDRRLHSQTQKQLAAALGVSRWQIYLAVSGQDVALRIIAQIERALVEPVPSRESPKPRLPPEKIREMFDLIWDYLLTKDSDESNRPTHKIG